MTNVVHLDTWEEVYCDSCGKKHTSFFKSEPCSIRNGGSITVSSDFSGFFDIDEKSMTLKLCHDCMLRVFRFFMTSDKYSSFEYTFVKSSHGYYDEEPCCEYGYDANKVMEEMGL